MPSLKEILDVYRKYDDSDYLFKDFTIIQNSWSKKVVFTDGDYFYKIMPKRISIKCKVIFEVFKRRNIDKFLVPFNTIYSGRNTDIICQKAAQPLDIPSLNKLEISSDLLIDREGINVNIPMQKGIIHDYPEDYKKIFKTAELLKIRDIYKQNCGILNGKIVLFDYEMHDKLPKENIAEVLEELKNSKDLIIDLIEATQ